MIGLEATLKLLARYEGQPVYVPEIGGDIISAMRDERIRGEFDGRTIRRWRNGTGCRCGTFTIIRPGPAGRGDLFA